jgi:hypothetical protein
LLSNKLRNTSTARLALGGWGTVERNGSMYKRCCFPLRTVEEQIRRRLYPRQQWCVSLCVRAWSRLFGLCELIAWVRACAVLYLSAVGARAE